MNPPLLWRWLSTTAALFVAVTVVPGITYIGTPFGLFVVAAVFGLVNALLKPLVTLLTCPLILVSFGLFTLVINALMLLATARVSASWNLGFDVTGFWAAFFGGLLVGLVNTALSVRSGWQNAPRR